MRAPGVPVTYGGDGGGNGAIEGGGQPGGGGAGKTPVGSDAVDKGQPLLLGWILLPGQGLGPLPDFGGGEMAPGPLTHGLAGLAPAGVDWARSVVAMA